MNLPELYTDQKPPARIYEGGELVYPEPVKDGLVLWYDFMGRKNSDAKRAVAEDLSGNGYDGDLVNFAYSGGSGYEDKREIEGRNLETGSHFNNDVTMGTKSFNGWLAIYGEHGVSDSVYKKTLTSNSGASRIEKALTLESGFYTITMCARADKNMILRTLVNAVFQGSNSEGIISASSDFATFSFVIEVPTSGEVILRWYHDFPEIGDSFEMDWIKIEKGTVATPWRPAMEDPEYEEWAKDKGFKRSLRFDGVDDYFEFANPFLYQDPLKSRFTLSLVSKIFNSNISSSPILLGLHLGIRASTGNRLLLYINSGVNDYYRYTITNMIDFERYNCLDFVFDNELGIIDIFCNGESIGSGSRANLTGIPIEHLTRISLRSHSANGKFESTKSLKLYNRALTPEEIAQNYAMEKERWNL